jgi:prevent-host-death family protein
MLRANITEIKNRLSHYLRLVKGGEEVEIIDRKTPLARIVGIVNRWRYSALYVDVLGKDP